MSKYDSNGQNLDDLLRQVDSLLEDEPEDDWFDESSPEDIDIDAYTPAEIRENQDSVFYQNYSNGYGSQIRNYRNGYGGQTPVPETPSPEPRRTEPSIPAYNADFREAQTQANKAKQRQAQEATRKIEYRDYGGQPEYYDEPPAKAPKKSKPKKKGCCGCGCSTLLIGLAVLIALVVGIFTFVFQPPKSDVSIGDRKRDTATILICGTDADGTRTDTIMLLYLSGSENQVGLLSLPRDTYTITSAGNAAKLNSAYGRNGTGEEGMEGLLDYVQDIIGYRPDGYILVDMTLVPQIVDLMGGVEFDVPQNMETAGITLKEGLQQLDGTQVLSLLRHRKGYFNADLGRVEVQRDVIKACMDQWINLGNLSKTGSALDMIQLNSTSSLSTRNYLWMAKTILFNMSGGFSTETLPGYADYIGGVSYYLLDREDVAQLINDSFNPYQVTISPEDLNIAG